MELKCNGRQSGFTLVEILVTLLILAVGLLGMAGLNARVLNGQFEAYQRSQALRLVEDMASRIRNNPKAARNGDYGSTTVYGVTEQDCGTGYSVNYDRCTWSEALRGVGVNSEGGAQQLGSIIGARGCIENISGPVTNKQAVVRVTVAWQGVSPSVAPSSSCGAGAYGADDSYRRTVSVDVVLAFLGD
ncbi:type IV pilus modification protein PilV [compost metagenome]